MYICIVEYHSSINKNEILPFATSWMDLEIIILSGINQTEKEILYHIHVESEKKKPQNYFKNRLIDIDAKLMVTKGKQGRDKLGLWD